ncbi:hypothetical protein [Mesorhizobium sp. M0589]|uniref:hypothetical protein n=1 Tax=Mesorhizobium sp. M0589 TaxID=2956965 RepID=UPI00333CC25A
MTDDVDIGEVTEAVELDRPETAPSNLNVCVSGLSEEDGTRLGHALLATIQTVSQYIRLERLDGVTAAVDYPRALVELDRGYETSHVLTPSTDIVYGIAMTPSVKRDGVIKSHIVLNANIVWPIQDPQNEFFRESLHIIAHECAHVEITKVFDEAFPNTLLSGQRWDFLEAARSDVILACWDEYAACRISARFGKDPLDGYVETMTTSLVSIREKANEHIKAYRTHGDHDRILLEIAGLYGNLMKFAGYLLGHMDGKGLKLPDVPQVEDALQGHWFAPFFEQLHQALRAIWSEYGQWTDRAAFEAVGDILEEVLAEIGLTFHRNGERLDFRLPFTADTMPPGDEWLAALATS